MEVNASTLSKRERKAVKKVADKMAAGFKGTWRAHVFRSLVLQSEKLKIWQKDEQNGHTRGLRYVGLL